MGFHVEDAALIHVTGGDEVVRDEFAQPRRSLRIVLVVVGSHGNKAQNPHSGPPMVSRPHRGHVASGPSVIKIASFSSRGSSGRGGRGSGSGPSSKRDMETERVTG